MRIKFSDKELRELKISVSHLEFCYLIAIANSNPEIWKQFKGYIEHVDREVKAKK